MNEKKCTGGELLANFRAGACPVVPARFWSGQIARDSADSRRLKRQVIIAGWRVPPITATQKLELIVLAQAAAGGTKPALSGGAWCSEVPRLSTNMFSLEVLRNQIRQPGMQAMDLRRKSRSAGLLARLSDSQRSKRLAAVSRKRAIEAMAALNVDCLVRSGAAWQNLCWWRKPSLWLPELSAEQQYTSSRMLRWGMVPKSVDDILTFVGMERDARRLFCDQSGAAIRKAATDSMWTCRRRGPGKEPDPPRPPPKQAPTPIPGDRGAWEGPSVGSQDLRDKQAEHHLTALQPALLAQQRAAALADNAARLALVAAAAPACGSFHRVTLTRRGGGIEIAASGSGPGSLDKFEKSVLDPLSRAWARLPRWWSWSDERRTRTGLRFGNIERI